MEVFVIHHIIRSRFVRRVSNGIFVVLLWFLFRFVSCYWWLTQLLIYWLVWFFSFSLKCVQFLEEELSLSHLHMLSHTCFYPGGLPCCFFPTDIIIWFADASAPYFGSCGSAVFACGCFPGVVQAWLPQPAAWCAAFSSAPLTCCRVSQGSLR